MSTVTSVVFLGGPMDGLEMDLPGEPLLYAFQQMREPPLTKLSIDELIDVARRPVRTARVVYKKTTVEKRGMRVYSLVRR